MPRSSFDFDRGVTQWRMEPLTGSPRAGSWAFTLGYDGLVPRYEDIAYGDYFQTSQEIDLTDVALIRCHVNITQPNTLPNYEDVSDTFQLIEESVDSPGNRIVIARGVSEADIHKYVTVSGAINGANNTTLKIVGLADSLTAYVDKAVVTEGPSSAISAIMLGARWKFSLLIDGVEYARCIQSERETGFYRNDLMLHCSKLTGDHTVSFRITLVEHIPNSTYAFFVGPPLEGLIMWVRGDDNLNGSAGLASEWIDRTQYHNDLDVVDAGFEPQIGIDDIDGTPALTFPAGEFRTRIRSASYMVDSNSQQIGYDTGMNPNRTIMVVMKPTTAMADGAMLTAGIVFGWRTGPHFSSTQCLMYLHPKFTPNDFYVYDTFGPYGPTQVKGPATPGATYDGLPTLMEWRFQDFPYIAAAINGASDLTLTPTAIPGGFLADNNPGFSLGNTNPGSGWSFNFQGCISEVLVWDYDLATNPTARAQAYAYLAYRYPSLGL